jgi:hypothetical protein
MLHFMITMLVWSNQEWRWRARRSNVWYGRSIHRDPGESTWRRRVVLCLTPWAGGIITVDREAESSSMANSSFRSFAIATKSSLRNLCKEAVCVEYYVFFISRYPWLQGVPRICAAKLVFVNILNLLNRACFYHGKGGGQRSRIVWLDDAAFLLYYF